MSANLCILVGLFPFEFEREDSGHNLVAISSSIPYNAYTKDPKSIYGNPIKCLTNRGCRLLIIMLIWSLSDGLSMIWEILSLQREMNDVTVSSGLYLKASNSLHETSMIVLNANYRRNYWAKLSHIRRPDTSKKANQRWAAPLDSFPIGVSADSCPLNGPWQWCHLIRVQLVSLDFGPQGVINKIYNLLHHILG